MARKQRIGTVLRDKNDNSVVVGVQWSQNHRVYGKARRRLSRFVAHDENNVATIGDRVVIEEARPMSRTKRWRVVEVLQQVDVAEVQPGDIDTEAALTGTEEAEG